MLIPALLAVLLGEAGGALARSRPALLAMASSALAVLVSGIGGAVLAPALTPSARTLLAGLALLIAGAGQLRAGISDVPPAVAVWSSSVPLTVFSLSLYAAAPIGAMTGGAIGLALVVVLGPCPNAVRRVCAAVLIVGGFLLALIGLRLL